MSKSSSFDESLDGLEVFDVPEMTLNVKVGEWSSLNISTTPGFENTLSMI